MVRGKLTVFYSEVVVSRQMQIGVFAGCEGIVNVHVFSHMPDWFCVVFWSVFHLNDSSNA